MNLKSILAPQRLLRFTSPVKRRVAHPLAAKLYFHIAHACFRGETLSHPPLWIPRLRERAAREKASKPQAPLRAKRHTVLWSGFSAKPPANSGRVVLPQCRPSICSWGDSQRSARRWHTDQLQSRKNCLHKDHKCVFPRGSSSPKLAGACGGHSLPSVAYSGYASPVKRFYAYSKSLPLSKRQSQLKAAVLPQWQQHWELRLSHRLSGAWSCMYE